MWKIISVVFISLFVLVVLFGIINTRFRMSLTEPQNEPTPNQIDLAKSIVAQDLQSRGDNISNYDVVVMNRMVGFINSPHPGERVMGSPMPVPIDPVDIQVSLHGNTTSYLYIINPDSQKVVMRSFTEWLS